jgi:sulfite reductase beta subunit-like hemoprotein
MEERLPTFDQQIKLHVTGCTNSCGQHWIADVGLEGKKIKQNGKWSTLLLLRRRRRREIRAHRPEAWLSGFRR